MRILNQDEFNLDKDLLIEEIKQGAIFIHPTDTIYGLGCDATNGKAVKKIRELKNRNSQPFSVIAPSKEWIKKNCECSRSELCDEWIGKLPGPYTLITKIKNPDSVSKHINPGIETLGVRMPDHWFTRLAEEAGIPLVTTSANKVGENYMTSLENLDPSIKGSVRFVVYEGEKKGKPSMLVDLSKEKLDIKER